MVPRETNDLFRITMDDKERVQPSFSQSKKNIRIGSCTRGNGHTSILYPLDQDPLTWPSCNDAYTYTWEHDFADELGAGTPPYCFLNPLPHLVQHSVGMQAVDVLKLSRSMGFCPQNRCQLSEVTNSPVPGQCPLNLCYTKVEGGRLSFGACCFNSDGTFMSGDIAGSYYQSQPEPKPIYDHSRVKLRSRKEQGFPADFINANMVFPGLILSQCPIAPVLNNISSSAHSFRSTVEDTLIMIIERNVSLYMQFAPLSRTGQAPEPIDRTRVYTSKTDLCRAFPFDFVGKTGELAKTPGVSEISYSHSPEMHYYTVRFRLTAIVRLSSEDQEVTFHKFVDDMNEEEREMCSELSELEVRAIDVEYIWYTNWEDFEPPPMEDLPVISSLAQKVVDRLSSGGGVIVSCLSGRGRSGTFAAIVLGKMNDVKTVSELVDVIVQLREHRDGIVELPSQLRYTAAALSLQDPALCGWRCRLSKRVSTGGSGSNTLIRGISLATGRALVSSHTPVFTLHMTQQRLLDSACTRASMVIVLIYVAVVLFRRFRRM